jgi:hypothetical protein
LPAILGDELYIEVEQEFEHVAMPGESDSEAGYPKIPARD